MLKEHSAVGTGMLMFGSVDKNDLWPGGQPSLRHPWLAM
jgi:hypothetical protein